MQCQGVVKNVSVGSGLTESLFLPVEGWMESLRRSENVAFTARAKACANHMLVNREMGQETEKTLHRP